MRYRLRAADDNSVPAAAAGCSQAISIAGRAIGSGAMGRIGALVPEVLRTEAQFRLLFAGQVLSLVGDRVMLVALPFAVLEAGGSIEAVGLVVTAQLVPFLVFALAGGVISDRGDRRRVLIASDVARLIVQGVGGVLLVADAASPLTLGVLAALYGTADAFFQPAFTGLLPQTVSHAGQLQPANALRGLSFSISSIAGPAIAGVLIGASGAGAAMLFDAAPSRSAWPACCGCARRWRSRGSRRPRRPSWPRSWPAGARSARARGSSPAWRRCARTRDRAARRLRAGPGLDRRAASAARARGRPSSSPSGWAASSATSCCCASARRTRC